jgi:hypothetical protein
MPKDEVWRQHAQDWQGILGRNLILKAANLGVTTAILAVGDREVELERALEGRHVDHDVDDAYSELSKALTELVNRSKRVIDKYNGTFGPACQRLAVIRNAAEHRKPVALQEVKTYRKSVADHCKTSHTQLANANDLAHLLEAWNHFVPYLEQHAAGINSLRQLIAQCKQHSKAGTLEHLKPDFSHLADACQKAATMS